MALKTRKIKTRIRNQGIEKTRIEILSLLDGLSQLTPGELTTEFAGELLVRVNLLREALIVSLQEEGYDPERFAESAQVSFWRNR